MTDRATDLEHSILAAYQLALKANQLDVAEHLLAALDQFAKECPQVEGTVIDALLMITPKFGKPRTKQ